MEENEYKLLLDADIYKKLSQYFINTDNSRIKRKLHINYYYDTKDLVLCKNNITLRIRQREDILMLEYKRTILCKEFLKRSIEYSQAAEMLPKSIDLKNTGWEYLMEVCEPALMQGVLITDRLSYEPEKGIKIDLDKNYYLGIVDYEIELEFESELKEKAYQILLSTGVNLVGQACIGKRNRFYNQLKQMHG